MLGIGTYERLPRLAYVRHWTVALLVDDGLADYIEEHASACTLTVHSGDEPHRVLAALNEAADAVRAIRHPDEPEEPLPSLVAVEDDASGPSIYFDLGDYCDHAPMVLEAIVKTLRAANIDGRLGPRSEEEPSYLYDPDADYLPANWYLLTKLDTRTGLPDGWPTQVPPPSGGDLVVAKQDGRSQTIGAVWRFPGLSSGIEQSYLSALVDVGFEVKRSLLGTLFHRFGRPREFFLSGHGPPATVVIHKGGEHLYVQVTTIKA